MVRGKGLAAIPADENLFSTSLNIHSNLKTNAENYFPKKFKIFSQYYSRRPTLHTIAR